jgi:hypothetical protein
MRTLQLTFRIRPTIGDNARMNRLPLFRPFSLLFVALLLTACSGAGTKPDMLDRTLYAYSAAIRWDEGNIDAALAFVDPKYQQTHPMSSIELERFKQVRVSGYYVKGSQQISETEYAQRVEIRLFNIHTQAERAVIDDQVWRWDEPAKTWLLTTGLPKIAETR